VRQDYPANSIQKEQGAAGITTAAVKFHSRSH
jgi:hypothetical protein